MKRKIESGDAPAALGPYSQAIAVDRGTLLAISGQLGMNPATGALVGDTVGAQTEQAIRNILAILKAAGAGPEAIVKTTVYLRHFEDFAAMNEVYGRMLVAPYPARATVGVAALPKDGLVEIEAIAIL